MANKHQKKSSAHKVDKHQNAQKHEPHEALPSNEKVVQSPLAVWLVLAAIVLFGLVLRLVYLSQIRPMGFWNVTLSDAQIYEDRAAGIVAGDWLGPEDFVHAPLYAYFMGAIRTVVGESLANVRIAQVLLSGASLIILFLTGRRFFNERVGLLAALFLAIFAPAIFFDGIIQKTSLSLFLSCLFLWQLARCMNNPGYVDWIFAGVILGLLGLTRQNALSLGLILLACTFWYGKDKTLKLKLAWCGAWLLALVLTLSPWVIRNKMVTGEFVLTTPNLGQNFAMGNHPDATGTYLPAKRGRASAEFEQEEWVREAERQQGAPPGSLSANEVSSFYLSSALDYIKGNPGHFLKLTGKKIALCWNIYETPDTEDYYVYAEHAPLLSTLDQVLHFGGLASFALLGIFLTRSNHRRYRPLYLWLIVTTLSVAVFVVFARYRFPMVPVLALFAAAGLIELVKLSCRKDTGKLITAAIILVVTYVLTSIPILHPPAPSVRGYLNHGVALARQHRYEEDFEQTHKALSLDPDNVDAHLAIGNTLLQLEQNDEALTHYRQALKGAPNDPVALRGVANGLLKKGEIENARLYFERAYQYESDNPRTLSGLATCLAQSDEIEKAIELFQQAIALNPKLADAHVNLANCYQLTDRADEALLHYKKAVRLDPRSLPGWHGMVGIYMQCEDFNRAIEAGQRVRELDPQNVQMQQFLLGLCLKHEDFKCLLDQVESMLDGPSFVADHTVPGIVSALLKKIAHRENVATLLRERALAVAERLYKSHDEPLPDVVHAYVLSLAALGNTELAIKVAQQAASTTSADSSAFKQLMQKLVEQCRQGHRPWEFD